MTWDNWHDWNCCGHGHHSKRRHHRDCKKADDVVIQCFGDNCFEVERRRRHRKDCGCKDW